MSEMNVELAHDLRMPLQLIYCSAEMLEMSLKDPAMNAATYVGMLKDSVNHMRRLLDGALDGSPAAIFEAPRPVNSDLSACLRRLYLRCRPFAEQQGVTLCCSGNASPLNMALDEDMLSRILLNLIFNALRYAPRGGRVTLRWRATGDFVEISVEDDGPGIPPERLPFVFLRGETDTGHGYGLPIAQRLAHAMGGELFARSVPGRGSIFTLRLPVRAAEAG